MSENKFTSIKDRVVQISDYKGIAKEKFFEEIGMTSANFRGNAKKTPLNSNAIENILSKHSDINPTWLLTGEGEMLLDKVGIELNQYSKTAKNEADLEAKAFTWMVFSMYKKESKTDFSFNSFSELSGIFETAALYMKLLQETLEVDIYKEVTNELNNNPKMDNDGSYIIAETTTNVIDKYADIYNKLTKISSDLALIIQDSSAIQKEIIANLKNKQ